MSKDTCSDIRINELITMALLQQSPELKPQTYAEKPKMGLVHQTGTNTAQPLTLIQQKDSNSNCNDSKLIWRHYFTYKLSIVICTAGILMFILNMLNLALGVRFYNTTRLLASIFMTITGGLGVDAATKRSRGLKICLIIMCILLSITSFMVFNSHVCLNLAATCKASHYQPFVSTYDYHTIFMNNWELDNQPFWSNLAYDARGYIKGYNCTHPFKTVHGVYCQPYRNAGGTYETYAYIQRQYSTDYIQTVKIVLNKLQAWIALGVCVCSLVHVVLCSVFSCAVCTDILCVGLENVHNQVC
ncbi:unnamed protein product [Owenia fusiformis]|uniref:Uncharacterized protein n=1 Tax=Owenia fusiformis TaxID=6347 RepID=A0A8J1U8Y2_OWEFU|nr:unnamed protein product [Owenia fusiformis]